MEKQILNFTVNEQILVCENPIKISTNKVNYIQASFDLGTNWSGFDSVRAVWFNDFNCISTVLDSLGNCAVPFEVMKRKGNVKVNLVGSISEDDVLTDRLTSYPVVAVIVDCTAQITGANTSPITPSEYEQFVAAVHEDAERAEAGATASEQSATDSANSASASAESAQEAEAHASSAQIYAGMASNEAEASANSASEAQTYAQNASESATSAEGYAEDAESARDTILGMRATANTLSEGSDATASYSNGLLTLGIPRGNTGATGPTGPQGETGATPNLSIGTVTTLDPDEDATATISGTAENPVLSFGIPKGDTGEVSLSELEDATVVQTLSDSTPYNYRRTNNGNGAGVREYDEIVGASVGWNQQVSIRSSDYSHSENGVTFTDNRDGTYTVQTDASGATANTYLAHWATLRGTVGHKILWMSTPQGGSSSTYYSYLASRVNPASNDYGNGRIYNVTESGNLNPVFAYIKSGTIITTPIKFRPQLIDLTLFNTQIADYVYTLEQGTAGSGVTWLKSHFPKLFDNGYQPFDSGSIKSVSGLTAHEMVGKNLFDKANTIQAYCDGSTKLNYNNDMTSVYVELKKGFTYTFSQQTQGQFTRYALTDSLEQGAAIYRPTAPTVAGYDTLSTFTITDAQFKYLICTVYRASVDAPNTFDTFADTCQLEFGSTATSYEPYQKHTYPLDSSVTLRGQYKLDANNNLYADGDVYKASGQVGRNWSEVSMGDLAWSYRADNGVFFANVSDMKKYASASIHAELICSRYTFGGTRGISTADLPNMMIYTRSTTGSTNIIVRDTSYTDTTAFTQMLSNNNVTLVYDLETPTTDTATPYTNPQWCDSHGTEEYVGSELPVGHNTDYPMSLADTMPTTNGTFEPRVTVTNGVRTVTWVSV